MGRLRTAIVGVSVCLALGVPAEVSARRGKRGAAAAAAKTSVKKAKRKAKRFEKKGKAAYAKGRWDDAIAAFELAHLAWPQPRYLFNIGRCWEKKGDLFTAMAFIERFVKSVQDEAEREDADEVYSILRSKLLRTSGEVVVRSEPDEATITLTPEDGERRTGATPWVVWLPAGTWTLRVALQDHEPVEETLVVPIGGTLERSYELREEGAAPAEPPDDGESPGDDGWTEDEAPGPDRRAEEAAVVPTGTGGGEGGGSLLSWAVLGGGTVLLAGGTVFGLLGRRANDDLERFAATPGTATEAEARDARDASDSHALTANVLFGAGAVAAGVGLYLLLTSGPEGAAAGGTSLRPWVSLGRGGAVLEGTW